MKTIEIPQKTYFKIGEVANLLGLEPYVLRYWETEFDCLKPRKTRSGQRSYQRKDIELLVRIQHLLHVEMFTIAGAREKLKEPAEDSDPGADVSSVVLEELREDVARLEKELSRAGEQLFELRQENGKLKSLENLKASEVGEVQRLRELLDASAAREQKLKDEREQALAQAAQYASQAQSLHKEVEAIRAQAESSNANASSRRAALDALRQELQSLSHLSHVH